MDGYFIDANGPKPTPAGNLSILELKIDAGCSGIQVSHPMGSPIPIA
jgi:hypothetical protein